MSDREPFLNLPPFVTVMSLALIAIHGVRAFLVDPESDVVLLLTFAFIPARFDGSLAASWGFPGGVAGDVWSFFTYAFLHADFVHLGVNILWFAVFGSAVARRFGTWRTLALFLACAGLGALAHLVGNAGQMAPMVGASGAVSGLTAAALRFAFQRGGPLAARGPDLDEAYRAPALSLPAMARNGPVVIMILVWIVLNVGFGAFSLPIPGAEGAIAWQAHLGGFIAGLLLFPVFDPVRLPQ